MNKKAKLNTALTNSQVVSLLAHHHQRHTWRGLHLRSLLLCSARRHLTELQQIPQHETRRLHIFTYGANPRPMWLAKLHKDREARQEENEHKWAYTSHLVLCSYVLTLFCHPTPLSHSHGNTTPPPPTPPGPYSHTPAIIPWYMLQLHAPPADVRAPPTCSNFAMVWWRCQTGRHLIGRAASAAEKARMRDDTALHITGKCRQAACRSMLVVMMIARARGIVWMLCSSCKPIMDTLLLLRIPSLCALLRPCRVPLILLQQHGGPTCLLPIRPPELGWCMDGHGCNLFTFAELRK